MSLKDFLPDKKKESEEYYWALVLEPGWVQAGIWLVVDRTAKVVSVSPPTAWELDTELVGAVDAALSAAAQGLSAEVPEPSKTVFGVVSSWVDEGQIRQEYLGKIKLICGKLSLTPSGFVVLPEAVAHFFKSEEGSPLNAVVLGFGKDNIEISIFKLGNLLGISQVARSVSVVDDVSEGLARFKGADPIPSRFILYNGREGELEEARQALFKADWDDFEKLKFLHTPKVEVVSPDKKVHAVAFAGASELADVKTVAVAKEEDGREEKAEEVQERDVVGAGEEEVKPEDLGFALGKDVARQPRVQESRGVSAREEEAVKPKDEPKEPAKEPVPKPKFPSFRKKFLSGIVGNIKGKASSVFAGVSLRPKLGVKFGKSAFIYGLGFFLIFLIAAAVFWWYYPKAQVTIYLSTKKLGEKVTITVDPAAEQPKLSERTLPGEVLATEVSSDKTRSTTGTKTVGERARGEVTLYRVGSGLSIPSGTTLDVPGELKFTLDEAVTVASGSAGTPGITKAAVTAADIGAQYNLAAGATFSVGNYSTSDVEAKNGASFSGGSSREISAVSEKDQTILEKELTDELKDEAREELIQGLSDDKLFIEDSLTATPSSRTFSHKIGDETPTLKLALTLVTKALAVGKKALTDLAKEVLADKVPEGFVLREDQIETEFEFEREVDGKFRLSANLSANLLPEVDPKSIVREIRGKYPSVAKKYLTEQIPGFVRAEISLKPKFPGRLGTLPRVAKHIKLEIAGER
jgi:hypothetical protein